MSPLYRGARRPGSPLEDVSAFIFSDDSRAGRIAGEDFFLKKTGGGRRPHNPFQDNLTLDVGVDVQRDTWLRSAEADTKITKLTDAEKAAWTGFRPARE